MRLLPLFIITPLFASILTAIIARRNNKLADFICGATGVLLLGLCVYLVIIFKDHTLLIFSQSRWGWPEGVLLVADSLSIILLSFIYFLFVIMSGYNFRFLKTIQQRWKYDVIVLLLLTGVNGVLIAADIFTMYVFLEIAAIASYTLVIFRNKSKAILSFFKYMVLGIFASALILIGIAVCYSYVSTFNMAEISRQISIRTQGSTIMDEKPAVCFMAVLFGIGIAMKTGLIPFLKCPINIQVRTKTPLTNIISVLFMPIVGIYFLVRVFFNVLMLGSEISGVLIFWSALLMVWGLIQAMLKNNFKKILAYFYISEMGICLLAFGVGSPITIVAGCMHLLHYMVNRTLLNAHAGIFEYKQNTTDFQQLENFKIKMPMSAITALIGSFSFIGIPPFSGFWTKVTIAAGAYQAGLKWVPLFMVMISLGTFVVFFKIQKNTFFKFRKNTQPRVLIQRLPFFMHSSIFVLAVVSLLVSALWLSSYKEMFLGPIARSMIDGAEYANYIMDVH